MIKSQGIIMNASYKKKIEAYKIQSSHSLEKKKYQKAMSLHKLIERTLYHIYYYYCTKYMYIHIWNQVHAYVPVLGMGVGSREVGLTYKMAMIKGIEVFIGSKKTTRKICTNTVFNILFFLIFFFLAICTFLLKMFTQYIC